MKKPIHRQIKLKMPDGSWLSIPGHGCVTDQDYRDYRKFLLSQGIEEGEGFKIEPPLP